MPIFWTVTIFNSVQTNPTKQETVRHNEARERICRCCSGRKSTFRLDGSSFYLRCMPTVAARPGWKPSGWSRHVGVARVDITALSEFGCGLALSRDANSNNKQAHGKERAHHPGPGVRNETVPPLAPSSVVIAVSFCGGVLWMGARWLTQRQPIRGSTANCHRHTFKAPVGTAPRFAAPIQASGHLLPSVPVGGPRHWRALTDSGEICGVARRMATRITRLPTSHGHLRRRCASGQLGSLSQRW